MDGPKRWRDDPELLGKLGIDLDAESSSLKSHDLDAMAKSLQTNIETGVTASSAHVATYVIGGALLGALLIGLGLLVAVSNDPPKRDLVPPPVVANVEIHEVRMVPKPSVATPPVVATPRPKPVAPPVVALRETPVATAPTTDLAAQLDQYERGQRALAATKSEEAIVEFGRYLKSYPDGRLRDEAQLGLLHATFAAEHYRRAAKLAAAMHASETTSTRRLEIARILAEAHALLGECEEAETAFALARTAATVRDNALARCRAEKQD